MLDQAFTFLAQADAATAPAAAEGLGVKNWTYIFIGLTFSLYLFIAWVCRVKTTKGFYVAGQGVPALANGMATGADWMSAASFIGMAGIISFAGYAGAQYLMGWTGGYVLLALLLAPYLRKFGHFTVPDFVGDRFDSNFARLVAIVCALFVSFTYVAGQMRGVGIVFSRFLEVEVNIGVVIGMAIVFVYATLGGMKGITWTQVAQYWVLITAFLIPAIAISIKMTGTPIPQVGLGSQVVETIDAARPVLLDKLNQINTDLGFSSYTDAYGYSGADGTKLLNMFCVTLALMAGTAGLPHVIVRFYTVKNVKAARWSAFWALLFIATLYLTAPATAVFARYYMIESTQGKTAEELPEWFNNWGQTGLVLWLDDGDGKLRYSNREDNEVFRGGTVTADADMKVAGTTYKKGDAISIADIRVDHTRWADAQGAKGAAGAPDAPGDSGTAGDSGAGGDAVKATATTKGKDWRPVLTAAKLAGPDRDIMVLATPEMAELASWIIALVAAGGLAAALSTASGLLLVISSSVAHDLYGRMINPEATEAKRLLVGRTVIGVSVIIAGLFGIYPPGFVSQVVAFAFGLAASSFFPVIVLGIFSKRVGTVPAIAGMLVGLGFTGTYIVGTVYGGWSNWCFGIAPTGIGTVGMLLNFVVTLVLTQFTPPPSQEIQDMVESIREPEAAGAAVNIDAAVDH